MDSKDLKYQPVEGKTYSLFGASESTGHFYHTIRYLADKILEGNDIDTILETIRKYSSRKKYLQRLANKDSGSSLISFCLHTINDELKPFTRNTEEHLRHLSPSKFWDRRLATTREQYHLYMLEIELTNRKNKSRFLSCDSRISLQPYCLQDFSVDCKAENTGFDNQCRFCSKNCFQNYASRILKENGVEPYIWMGASISKAAKTAHKNGQTLGILGIACVPELVWGMRKCSKYHIPVVGIPLNANRCVRWYGEFHQNSIDLNELEKLLKA
jgi:hypothetical protein